jgi:hypothetical protein
MPLTIIVNFKGFYVSATLHFIKFTLHFSRPGCSEGKSDGGNEEAIRKGSAALLPTVENLHGAV